MMDNYDNDHNIEDIPSTYICGICNQMFNEKNDFEDHIASHGTKISAGIDASEYTQTPVKHSILKQTTEKTFISNVDNSNQVHNLQGSTVKKEPQELLKCQNSEKKRSRIQFLNGKCRFKCDICNKLCVTKNSLKEHKLIHSGERPHKCKKCLRTFRFYYNFLRHLGTHGKPSFECQICPKVYTSKDSLKKHFFACHGQESTDGYTCSLCDKQLSRIDSLWYHYLNHINRYSFKCKVCNKGFKTRFSLKSHTRTHSDPSCETTVNSPSEDCNKLLKTKENLGGNTSTKNKKLSEKTLVSDVDNSDPVHEELLVEGTIIKKEPQELSQCHTIEKERSRVHFPNKKYKFMCDICNKICVSKIALKEHKLIHSGERPHKCEKCLRTFRFYYNFLRHQGTHEKPSFKCQICPKAYTSKDSLKKHFFTQHAHESPDGFNCLLCEKQLSRIDSLWEHYLNHVTRYSFKCKVCNKGFETRFALKSHSRIHLDPFHETVVDSPFDVSDEAFKTKENLGDKNKKLLDASNPDSEKILVSNWDNSNEVLKEPFIQGTIIKKEPQESSQCHTIEKRRSRVQLPNEKYKFMCDICNKICVSKNALNEHKLIHSGERPHKCKKCLRSFRFYYNFLRHQGTHEKPSFKCQICPKAYTSKDSLKKHFFSQHTHESPDGFNCSLCEKQLSSIDSLWKHYLNHVNRYSFKCKVCNKDFETRFALKSHSRLHPDPLDETAADSPSEVKCNSGSKHVASENQESSELHNFKCNTCSRNFQNVILLQKHMLCHSKLVKNRVLQSDKNIKICMVGDEESHSDSNQSSQKKEISAIGQNKVFAPDSDVVSLQNPKGKGKYVCHTCSKCFKAQRCLVEHELIHSGEKPHKCEKCSKRFRFRQNLIRHTLIHGKPTYECEACNKVFFTKDALKKHSVSHSSLGTQSVSSSIADDKAISTSVLYNECNNMNELAAKDNSYVSNQMHIELQTQQHAERKLQEISFQNKLSKYTSETNVSNKYNVKKAFSSASDPQFRDELQPHSEPCPLNEIQEGISKQKMTHETDIKIEDTNSVHQSKNSQKFSRPFHNMEFKEEELLIVSDSSDVLFSLQHCKRKGKYFCYMCNKKFRDKKHFKKHEITHKGEKNYKCNKCSQSFGFYRNFFKHACTHKKPSFKCEICQKVFLTTDILKEHLNRKHSHKSKNSFKCILCRKVLSTKQSLQQHYLIHTGEKPFSCEICNKDFKRKYCLLIHQYTHVNEKYFVCSTCSKVFNSQSLLKKHCENELHCKKVNLSVKPNDNNFQIAAVPQMHASDHVKDTNISILCFERDNIVNDQSIIKEDIQFSKKIETSKSELIEESTSDDQNIRAESQSGSYLLDENLRKISEHKGNSEFLSVQKDHSVVKIVDTCLPCPSKRILEFPVQDKLSTMKPVVAFAKSKQKQEELSQSPDNLVCEEKELMSVPNTSHAIVSEQYSKGKGKYACSTCKKQFKAKKSLEEHENIHSGEKPYKCDKCSRSFSFYCNFVRHALIHAKPSFECEICNTKFRTKENLKRHKLSNHSNSFKCEICERKLSTKLNLQNHYLTHIKEKPSTSDDQNIKAESQSGSNSYPLDKSLGKISEQKGTLEAVVKIVDTDSPNQSKKILKIPLQNKLSTMKPVLAFAESKEKQEELSQSPDNLVGEEKELMNVPNISHTIVSEQNFKSKGKYACSTCKKQFKAKKSLEEHENIHSGEKPYKCDKCSRSFSFYCNFVRHALIHAKPSFECEICNTKFRTKENLKRHKLSNHSNSFKCEICKRKLSTKLNLQKHYLTHTGKKPSALEDQNIRDESQSGSDSYSLDENLGKFSKQRRTLEAVVKNVDTNSPCQPKKILVILLQDKLSTLKPVLSFADLKKEQELSQSPDNLVSEEKELMSASNTSHDIVSEQNFKSKGKYTCSTCKKRFKAKKSLEEHENIHSGEKPYKCDKCSKSFSFYGNFVRHALIHAKPSFECEICDQKFRTKENVKRHKLSNHSDNFKCEICERKLSTKLNLQHHYLTHTGEKPFTCEFCNKRFARKCVLIQHEQTHTDKQNMLPDKISTLEPCLAFAESNQKQEEIPQFSNNSVCKEKIPNPHILISKKNCKSKTIYTCATCKKQFPYMKALKEHESIHTGEKPYKCNKCSRSFGFYGNFVRHTLTHKEPSFECEFCNKKLRTKDSLKKHKLSNHSNKKVRKNSLQKVL